MRVPADINQAAALKRHCQLNFTKKEEKPFFAEDLLLFCCFPEIFPEPSRHHLQFISIFCSCERLLHFLCALFCGTILSVRGFQSLTLCAPPTQTQQSHSVRQEYYIATWKWLIFMVFVTAVIILCLTSVWGIITVPVLEWQYEFAGCKLGSFYRFLKRTYNIVTESVGCKITIGYNLRLIFSLYLLTVWLISTIKTS